MRACVTSNEDLFSVLSKGQLSMCTLLMCAISSGPPMDLRSSQRQITKCSSAGRLFLQMSPGIYVTYESSDNCKYARKVRFTRQEGNHSETSPHLAKQSRARDRGNVNPLCHMRFGHLWISKSSRKEKLPNLPVANDNNPKQFLT